MSSEKTSGLLGLAATPGDSIYGHPAVEGILMWGFWAGAHWRGADAALVDLDGVLIAIALFAIGLPYAMLIGVFVALLALAFCAWARRRGGVARGAHAVLVCSIAYLMVFNPVTEKNAYVMLGAIVAPYAAAAIVNGRHNRILR